MIESSAQSATELLDASSVVATDHPRRTLDPALLFAVVLAAMTCLALAYVVTNFGTLFRLRLLVAAPLWVIPVLRLRSREATPTITPASIHVP